MKTTNHRPRKVLDAQSNLEAFVARGKTSKAFGNVPWGESLWVISDPDNGVGWKQAKTKTLAFTETSETRAFGASMVEPFASFLKAALRIWADGRRRQLANYAAVIQTSRHLYAVIGDIDYDPCRLTRRHLDDAIEAIRASSTAGSAYRKGASLEVLAGWIDTYNIGRIHLGWKNPLKAHDTQFTLSKEAAQTRSRKMPSEAALDALPLLANLIQDTGDLIRIRFIELLACGGWRMNELIGVSADCEVEEPATRDGVQIFDAAGNPVVRYGIKYFGLKGFGPSIKWIPTPMVDVARRAVRDVLRLTQEVRDDLVWIEANPGRHPLFKHMDPQAEIGAEDLGQILGLSGPVPAAAWLRNNNVSRGRGFPGRGPARLSVKVVDVEKAMLKYSVSERVLGRPPYQFLFLVRRNAMHAKKGAISGTAELMQQSQINHFLRSIFEKYKMTEPDGSPIRVTSHQFRHWLNTLAQEGGMSQQLIARWSGRKDVRQNSVYDHVSASKMAEKMRELADRGELVGQIARSSDALVPAHRRDFLEAEIAFAHVTEIGLCIHDWSVLPCQLHGDCSGCDEHVISKGDAQQKTEAIRQLEVTERMLAVAEGEAADGTYGAGRWLDAHKRRVVSLREVVAVHNDDRIPDGTLVHFGARVEARVTVNDLPVSRARTEEI